VTLYYTSTTPITTLCVDVRDLCCTHLIVLLKMGFDVLTRTLLENYSIRAPHFVDVWYGPWNTILTTLFPTSQGYVVTPRRRVEDVSTLQIPDLIIEVTKVALPSLTPRAVLIFEMKNSQHWDHGVEALMQKIRRRSEREFSGLACYKFYWIMAIGPHWVYGEKEDDEQDPKPLIGWHDVTHDDASYRNLLQLAELVAGL
jgi:hypothetical protein